MKKLTKRQIKEEIIRVVGRQEKAYWVGYEVFLCLSFREYELSEKMIAWIKEQGILVGYSISVESSHFSKYMERDINSMSCASIFRTMILIEFAKSLGVKI